MIDCLKTANAAINKVNFDGFKVDPVKRKVFERDCDDMTFMDGLEIESLVVQVDLNSKDISLKIGTYFMAIEEFDHKIIDLFKKAKEFSFYIAGKGTPDAMAVIDVKLPGIWVEGEV